MLAEEDTGGYDDARRLERLHALRPQFEAAESDPRRQRVHHYRDKFIAHHGRPREAVPLPLLGEVYGFAGLTAELMDDFAHAAGIAGDRYTAARTIDAEDAGRFWARWER